MNNNKSIHVNCMLCSSTNIDKRFALIIPCDWKKCECDNYYFCNNCATKFYNYSLYLLNFRMNSSHTDSFTEFCGIGEIFLSNVKIVFYKNFIKKACSFCPSNNSCIKFERIYTNCKPSYICIGCLKPLR